MPPKDAPQPSEAEREQLLGWINAALDAEATARAGDPGPVTLRRLSNAEYDNAIRDLTGVDMRPTRAREFPTDSVGGEGFANVGDAMPVTPELVERYHQTARDVAARVVLLPTGSERVVPPTAGELKQASFLRMPIAEASAKIRNHPASHEPAEFRDTPVWAGEIPITMQIGAPTPCAELRAGTAESAELAYYRAGDPLDDALLRIRRASRSRS